MENKLTQLYNTLSQIETKGSNTKLMGLCLQFIENMIAEERAAKKESEIPKIESDENEA